MTNTINLKLVSQNYDILNIPITKLEINSELEDFWATFVKNSVASFRKSLLRFTSDNKQYYLILDNDFITWIDNEINLKYNDELSFYVSADENDEFVKNAEVELNKYKKELKLQKAYANLNLNVLSQTRIEELNTLMFKLKAIVNFSIKPKEIKWK
ncbi:MSC_0621 family F1-like ATPase epsilon subunit [Mycoplasmopsis adleri]|uniref:MSC_0621 family F1-like ATPase epsilon subunit n=1 Tax=Mycoplasmopsis adleri TaxID=51362 RepID=UPI00387366D6